MAPIRCRIFEFELVPGPVGCYAETPRQDWTQASYGTATGDWCAVYAQRFDARLYQYWFEGDAEDDGLGVGCR
jgi:hypothetical protein